MLEDDGYEWMRQVVPKVTIEALKNESDRLFAVEPDATQGIRDLLRKAPIIRDLAYASWLRSRVPASLVAVRGILFDKNPNANWLVAWHQDLTICVREQHDVSGYGPWSVKHGVPHVQPPASLLEQMITVRIHLDDTHAANGALRVISGSHLHGRLSTDDIQAWRERTEPQCCEAAPGDVLLIKPLLLHASSKAESPAHRRVVHLEFAPRDALATELAWYESAL